MSLNPKRSEDFLCQSLVQNGGGHGPAASLEPCPPDAFSDPRFYFSPLFRCASPIVPLAGPKPQPRRQRLRLPLRTVRSPPCPYRSAKQIKALSQITYPRHLHNSRTRAAEALPVSRSQQPLDVKLKNANAELNANLFFFFFCWLRI